MIFKRLVTKIWKLANRTLSTRTVFETDNRTRWFVNYSREYFQRNANYERMFSLLKCKPDVIVSTTSVDEDNLCKIQERLDRFAVLKRKEDMVNFDEEWVKLLNSKNLNLHASFSLLYGWHSLAGGSVFETNFYKAVLCMWSREVSHCTIPELVSMLFFLGQTKKQPRDLIGSIHKRLQELCDQPSFDEWTFVCHNFFVMKIPLSPVIMEPVLRATICSLPNVDLHQLIAALKALRHSRHPIQDLLPPLSNFILQTCHEYTFVECTNFLATYANADCYSSDVFGSIERHVFDRPLPELLPKAVSLDLKRLHPNVRVRSKDIARFLWAMAHVRHDLATRNLGYLLTILRRKITEGDFIHNPHHLVDCLQSLIIYNRYPEDLLAYALNETFVKRCTNLGKAKPCHQLFFVSCSMAIECPSYAGCRISPEFVCKLGSSLKCSTIKELRSRKGLSELLTMVKKCYNVGEDKVKCISLLPHIFIAGIVIQPIKKVQGIVELSSLNDRTLTNPGKLLRGGLDLGSYVSLEVVDNSVLIGHQGLFATKIRQMEKLGCRIVTLTTDTVMEIVEMHEREAREKMNQMIFGV